MKKNIEHIIKESLENHELPYNSEAWTAMSSKLDASSASSAGDSSSIDSAIKSSLENNVYPYNPQAWDAMNARLDANAGSGVDQAIKSSLENYELPYAASAWTALSVKLDAKNTPKSNTRWYAAASVLIAAAVVSYFVINGSTEESNPKTNNTEIAKNDNTGETTSKKVSTSNQTNTTDNSSTISNSTDENASNNNPNQNSNPSVNENPTNNLFAGNQGGGQDSGNGNGSGNNPTDPDANKGGGTSSGNDNTVNPNVIPVLEDFVMPNIPSVCQGTSIHIANSNKYNVTIIYPNGAIWTGKPQSETTLTTSASGLYRVGYLLNGEMMEEGSFTVKPAPSADFEFVDLGEIILDGLPTTEVKTNSPGIKYEWKFGKETATGSEAAPHFFTKGNHDIELTVTGSNGCKSNVIKTVSIDETYNLLATNAFDPRSLDSRNNTFIPRALVERENVQFSMIIVDPNDGHIMYETSDASQGWDGVDRATGEQLDYQKTFIWKVTIENPELGERPVYGGSAVIIPRQN